MTKIILKAKKRKAGTRAGMTRAKIVDAATKLWLSGGPDNFSIRAVAKCLNVVPTTIRAHFKRGMGELLNEIAGSAAAALAPPYKPQQDPKVYLRGLFHSALFAFRQKPQLGRLVVLRLSNDPFLNPVFAERICATLAAIAKKGDVARGLHIFLEHFAGLIIVETSSWAAGKPEEAKAKALEQIEALSSTEFPTLRIAGEMLAVDLKKRGAPGYLKKTADAAADALIAALANNGS